jgi:hypothetical protein
LANAKSSAEERIAVPLGPSWTDRSFWASVDSFLARPLFAVAARLSDARNGQRGNCHVFHVSRRAPPCAHFVGEWISCSASGAMPSRRAVDIAIPKRLDAAGGHVVPLRVATNMPTRRFEVGSFGQVLRAA